MYTFKLIKDNWHFNNDHYENVLIVSDKDGDDIDAIISNIYALIINHCKFKNANNINEDSFAKMLAKIKTQKGIPPSEYVASKVGYKYHSESSFYDNIEIEIEISPNNIQKGIIRISDHEVDLNNQAKNNSKYDFGLSFVFKETSCEWQGNDIVEVPNRQIVICEYTYIVSRNQLNFLNYLTSEILNIRQNKKFISETSIAGKQNKIISNRLAENIYNAIKNAIYEAFHK